MRSMAIEGGLEWVVRVCLVLAPLGLLPAAPASAQMSLSTSERSAAFKPRVSGWRAAGGADAEIQARRTIKPGRSIA